MSHGADVLVEVADVPLWVRLFRHELVPPQNRGPGPSLSRRGRSPGAGGCSA